MSNLTGNNQQLAPLGAAGVFPVGPFLISTTIKDYGSLRGRVGVAFDRFLAFGTAGWACGNLSTSYALIGYPAISAGTSRFISFRSALLILLPIFRVRREQKNG